MAKPPKTKELQADMIRNMYEEVELLQAKVQHLVDYMAARGLLEEDCYTFPDGDTWEATLNLKRIEQDITEHEALLRQLDKIAALVMHHDERTAAIGSPMPEDQVRYMCLVQAQQHYQGAVHPASAEVLKTAQAFFEFVRPRVTLAAELPGEPYEPTANKLTIQRTTPEGVGD